MKVSEVMIDKPPVVTRQDTIAQAARLIDELHTSLVPVVDDLDSRRVVGVLTDKDVMRCTASGGSPQDAYVSDFMGDSFETVPVDADVEKALTEVQHVQTSSGDTGSGTTGAQGLMGRRPIVVIDTNQRVVGLITRPHLAMDLAKLQSGQVVS